MLSEHKSPKHKLLKFFEHSRDKWKEKAKQSKADIKNLNCKLRYHQQKTHELNIEIQKLKDQLNQLQQQSDKKKQK